MAAGALSAQAEGVNHVVDRVVVLTGIHMRYEIRAPAGAPKETIDRALQTHAGKCPTARSLEGAVEVTWEAGVSWEEDGAAGATA